MRCISPKNGTVVVVMPSSAILKENKIRGYSHYTKPKFIDLLISRVLLPGEAGTKKGNQETAKKEIGPKSDFLKQIRNSLTNFEIRNIETDEVIVYPSMYKAGKALDQPTIISIRI